MYLTHILIKNIFHIIFYILNTFIYFKFLFSFRLQHSYLLKSINRLQIFNTITLGPYSEFPLISNLYFNYSKPKSKIKNEYIFLMNFSISASKPSFYNIHSFKTTIFPYLHSFYTFFHILQLSSFITQKDFDCLCFDNYALIKT